MCHSLPRLKVKTQTQRWFWILFNALNDTYLDNITSKWSQRGVDPEAISFYARSKCDLAALTSWMLLLWRNVK